MRKILAALLVLAMVLALVPAVMAEGEALEPITLTAFVGNPGDQPTDDNKIYKLVEEKFGITFKWEFLAGDLDERLGMMNAAEDWPDLVDGSNSSDKLIEAGALINLMPYLSAEKTPNIWAHIESQLPRLVEKIDGEDTLYIIPNYGLPDGPQIALSVGGPGFFIQKQVLADAGYPDVKSVTLDQYFDLIEGFLAKHPTTGNAIPSPYVAMSQSFSKQANNLWYQIYQVVKENCSVEYKGATPHDDMMERLLSARRGG